MANLFLQAKIIACQRGTKFDAKYKRWHQRKDHTLSPTEGKVKFAGLKVRKP
ncbi:bL27 family ribosomal protein [Vibrio chagasii]|nr:bL27 family ribosomal protein [Vibrio chagasii]